MLRKRFALSAAAAVLLAVVSLAAQSGSRSARVISPPGAKPSPNFSHGILAGKTLYLSGQQGTDDSGKLVDGIGPQTQAALEDLGKILKAAGFSMNDVVSVTVYLADIHDFQAMNKVYDSILPDPKPTRTTIQAAALANDGRIEISMIAVKP
jgi:2-iminobutanoate/2-iminopropanoate deaminase